MTTILSHPDRPGANGVVVPEIIDILEAALEVSFDCWQWEGTAWLRLSQATKIDGLADQWDRCRTQQQPLFVESIQVALLVVPFVDEHGVEFIFAGQLTTQEPRWAVSLARTIVHEFKLRQQISQLQQQIEACNVQISDDFEDLAFLRQIAGHLDIAGMGGRVGEFAKAVLQSLQRSIRARSIVLVGAPRNSEDQDLSPTLYVGEFSDAEDNYRRIVSRFASTSLQPVVLNQASMHDNGFEFAGVNSLIIVRISKQEELFGWLLAVNRSKHPGTLRRSDAEFGTAEASLVEIAASVLASHLRNVKLFREKEDLVVSLVRSLVSAIETRDAYTCGHSERVAIFAKRLAEAIGLDVDGCDRIYFSGLLHDVGKIGISDAALSKPGALTPEERSEIEQHPQLGWQILQASEQLSAVFPGVVHHHERIDGKGYPDRLAGADIPLDARILAVADAYDAMTSDRPYRQGLSQNQVKAILEAGAGTQWDDEIVRVFIRIMPEIVELRKSYQRPTRPGRNSLPETSKG